MSTTISKPEFVSADVDSMSVSLTVDNPPPASTSHLEYAQYGSDYPSASPPTSATPDPSVSGKIPIPDPTSTTISISALTPMTTYRVRAVVTTSDGGRIEGDEAILDTPPPGCSGSKKKSRCVIS